MPNSAKRSHRSGALPIDFSWKNLLPFLGWIELVTSRTIRADIFAGLTGAVIVLPQGVAFATIAGLPPEYGLYSAIVPAIIAALFGSSFHLISGPTTAISLVVFANVSLLAEPFTAEYIAKVLALTLMAGCIQFGLGLARLGGLVNFVSHSVVVGFTAGAAILIATSQLGNFAGIEFPAGLGFFEKWTHVFSHLGQISLPVLAVALTTLLLSLLLKSRWPKQPGMLYAMIAGSILAQLLGGEQAGIALVGSLPAHLPEFSMPDLSMETLRELAPGALAVAMLGLAEAVSIGRSVATHSRQFINNNQEFIGQGLSNIVGSFFSSYAASGSFTRTGLNYTAGAKTPLAAVFAATFLAGILLLIAPLTAYLPIASMAGVLMLVAYRLIDFRHIRDIMNTSRSEFSVLAVTFTATLVLHLEFAIYVGVLLSLLLYLNKASHPHLVTLTPRLQQGPRSISHDRDFMQSDGGTEIECPQTKIIRLDGEIFFGAVNHIIEELHHIVRDSPEQCHILIVCDGINFIDVAGCDMLAHEAHALRVDGRQLYLSSLKPEVREMLEKAGTLRAIGYDNIFENKREAIRGVTELLDPERCRHCTVRIFEECDRKPKAKLPLY